MLSEKFYCILFGIIVFVILYQLKIKEGFESCSPSYVRFKYCRIGNSKSCRSLRDRYYPVPIRINYVGSTLNDKITEIKLQPGYMINVYQHANYRGWKKLYKGSDNTTIKLYGSRYADNISSFEVAPELNKYHKRSSGSRYRPRSGPYLTLYSSVGTRYYSIPSSKKLDIGFVNYDLNDKITGFNLPKGYVISFYQHAAFDKSFPGNFKTYYGTGSRRTPFRGASAFAIRPGYHSSQVSYTGTSNYSGMKRLFCGSRNAPKPAPTRRPKPIANCSRVSNLANSYSRAYTNEKNRQKQLQASLNKIRQERQSCQASINNSHRDMTADQKNTLVAAQKQLQSSRNVLKDAVGAYNRTKQALWHQRRAERIMKRDNNESIKVLQKANEQTEDANKKFSKKQESEFKLVNISPLDKEFFEDTPIQGAPNWQAEWGKDLS